MNIALGRSAALITSTLRNLGISLFDPVKQNLFLFLADAILFAVFLIFYVRRRMRGALEISDVHHILNPPNATSQCCLQFCVLPVLLELLLSTIKIWRASCVCRLRV